MRWHSMFEELGGFDAVEKWQEPKIRDKCSLDGKMSWQGIQIMYKGSRKLLKDLISKAVS